MFTYWSYSDSKEIYKKGCYTCKVVVLPCQPIPFPRFRCRRRLLANATMKMNKQSYRSAALSILRKSQFAGKYRGKRKIAHGVTVK